MKKEEKLSDALNFLSEELLLETEHIRGGKKRLRTNRYKKLAAAAACCVFILLGAGALYLADKKEPAPVKPETKELPKLTVTAITDDGMGYEELLTYDILELADTEVWSAERERKTLPVFENVLEYNEQYMLVNPDFVKMQETAEKAARMIGLKEGYSVRIEENRSVESDSYIYPRVLIETEEVTISTDAELTTGVYYADGIALAENELTEDVLSSYDTAMQAAKVLKEEYGGMFGFSDPQVHLTGGSCSSDGSRSYQIEMFEGGENDEQKLVNSCFNKVIFGIYEGKLSGFTIFGPDLSRKAGDYPLISAEEAKNLLMAGHYITTVPYELPGEEAVQKAELVYRTGSLEKYFMPYYKFYVELAEEEEADGLKHYGIYYVPAVEGRYLQEMPAWNGYFQ